jgi:hypothetical protein
MDTLTIIKKLSTIDKKINDLLLDVDHVELLKVLGNPNCMIQSDLRLFLRDCIKIV